MEYYIYVNGYTNRNALKENLEVFSGVYDYKFFKQYPIVILLNMTDLFREYLSYIKEEIIMN